MRWFCSVILSFAFPLLLDFGFFSLACSFSVETSLLIFAKPMTSLTLVCEQVEKDEKEGRGNVNALCPILSQFSEDWYVAVLVFSAA